jgi:membrane associated rhomboid family serine protease
MEQTTDARTLVEQGEALLLKGEVAEAAAEFNRAAQLEPSLAGAHLGMAEANLALGAFGVVYAACRQVQQLAPDTGDGALARAILSVLDRRYDVALRDLEMVESLQPGRAYAHALRAYCFRRLGNSYDANLAESKAARLSGSRELAKLFPPAPDAAALIPPPPAPTATNGGNGANGAFGPRGPNAPYTSPRPWNERSNFERRMVQARFLTRGTTIVTNALLAINIAVFAIGFLDPQLNRTLFDLGAEQGTLIFSDPTQWYRLLTAMFLHLGFAHIFSNMLSLYFVGPLTERLFGSGRFALIYFASGIIGGITLAVLAPNQPAVGASGAIFGIFGAFGAFALLRRRQLGPAGRSILNQWVFFLLLNLALPLVLPGIAWQDHLGGVISGFALGAIFTATAGRRRMF